MFYLYNPIQHCLMGDEESFEFLSFGEAEKWVSLFKHLIVVGCWELDSLGDPR